MLGIIKDKLCELCINYLIANGEIKLLCNKGDDVYEVSKCRSGYQITQKEFDYYMNDRIGHTIFLTLEDALRKVHTLWAEEKK
jgi:hypothetical protein